MVPPHNILKESLSSIPFHSCADSSLSQRWPTGQQRQLPSPRKPQTGVVPGNPQEPTPRPALRNPPEPPLSQGPVPRMPSKRPKSAGSTSGPEAKPPNGRSTGGNSAESKYELPKKRANARTAPIRRFPDRPNVKPAPKSTGNAVGKTAPTVAPRQSKQRTWSGPPPWKTKPRTADQPNAGIARTRHAPARPDVSAVPSGTTNIEGGAKQKRGPKLSISYRTRIEQGAEERTATVIMRRPEEVAGETANAVEVPFPFSTLTPTDILTPWFLAILRVGPQAEEGTVLRL